MSAVLSESYFDDDFLPESSKLILTSKDAIDLQETVRHESSEYESSYYHDTDSENGPEDDYLNREANTTENAWNLRYNREQASPYTFSPPSGRRIRGTIHYEPDDESDPLGFSDPGFSILASPDCFSDEGDENVKTESIATEAASNLSGTTLASIESLRSGSQVFTEPILSRLAVPGNSSQDAPSPYHDNSQHSINSCYCSCHNYGCPRQRPVLLRQESSPSALMIPFDRRYNFYNPPYSHDV